MFLITLDYQIVRKYRYETGDEDGRRGVDFFSTKKKGSKTFSEKIRGEDFFRKKIQSQNPAYVPGKFWPKENEWNTNESSYKFRI